MLNEVSFAPNPITIYKNIHIIIMDSFNDSVITEKLLF